MKGVLQLPKNKAADFYRLTEILRHKAQYNLIYGERSNGKSYAVKEYCLKRFRDYAEEFVVIRRLKSDVTKALSDLYFSDAPIEDIFGDKYNCIYTQSGRVYLAFLDEDGKRKNPTLCGYVRALSEAQRYSSGAYNNVQNIVLEEFISLDGRYLPNEIMLFRHIISTIARKRDVNVFMIANTISRLSPYFREFGVKNIERQAIGTIDDYIIDGEAGKIKIACEYCANTKTRSKMFFGADSKMTNEGKWLTNEYPHITLEMLEQSDEVFLFIVEYNDTRFCCRVMQNRETNATYLYITPKTTAVKDYTTVYTNRTTDNPYYRRGLVPRTARERDILALIDDRAFYSDNLTGTEFSETVKKLKIL